MLNYTAIDFETANSFRGSPCSVGLVKVRNGEPVDERHWLIRPPRDADWFDPWNVAIHGITPEMVEGSPRWHDVLPQIEEFIAGDIVIAHNAAFDTGVIRSACAVDNIEWPEIRFLCTMVLARRALALPSYRLPFVVESLGAALTDHHDALADARAVVDVVRGLAALQDAADLEALVSSTGVRVGLMSGGLYRGSVATAAGGGSSLVRADLDPAADPEGYLYGRVVVFTGKLLSMTRQVAWDECSKIGAIAEGDTTKRTQVLVIGDIDPEVLRPGSHLTGKARKAFELQDKGQKIEVMTEDDFLRCLDGGTLDLTSELSSDDAGTAVPIAHLAPTSRDRATPLDRRVPPPPPKHQQVLAPPKPLRRDPKPTDQPCAVDGCRQTAAFKTRSRPTWCHEHIGDFYRAGGLRLLDEFSHPEDWLLTECLTCTVQAHYRLVYVLDKNSWNEPVCRACYWRGWSREVGDSHGVYADDAVISSDEARRFAEEHGFDYLGPLAAPARSGDPHHTQCRRCGKISAERLGDISFGCTCMPRK